MARSDDIVSGLGHDVDRRVPVHRHVLDKLEGVHVGLVVLGEVGGHLQGGVEGDVKSQLVADGVAHEVAVPGGVALHVGFEDAGGVVHRATLEACEGQDGGVAGVDAAAELGAHGALVADHVGPCAAEARGAHGLVGVDHNVVLGGLDNGAVVVVDDGLAVVVLAVGHDVAHIAALDGIVAILVHEVVGPLHKALVVGDRRGALVVHDEADALLVSVFVQRRQVEVGVGGEEVEDIVLVLAVPVLPADVPPFDEEGVETVGGGKVDVASHVGVVGPVAAVGLGLAVVGDGALQRRRQRGVAGQAHGGEVVGVAPGAVVADHLPPHTHVLHGVYPADILQGARLVEVEDEARAQHIGGLVAHLDGAPRGIAGRCEAAHIASGVGREVYF